MKKIISINISNSAFFIDEDAYECLKKYLDKLKNRFDTDEEGAEIISDVEIRLTELFSERINPKIGVITIAMVHDAIKIMGQPEDFPENENTEKSNYSNSGYAYNKNNRRLYRDIENEKLGGVCAGIAAYFNIDPVFVRVIFAILPFISFGIVIPVYFVMWLVVPAAITASQKMEMRGENITVSNIEKKIKDEFEDVKKQFENFKKKNKTYKQSEDYLKKMNKRDKTLLIVVCAIILLIVSTKITTGISNIYLFHGLLPITLFFPGFITIAIILLILGLIFRSSFRVFAYSILIIAVISIIVKITFWFLKTGINFPFWW